MDSTGLIFSDTGTFCTARRQPAMKAKLQHARGILPKQITHQARVLFGFPCGGL